MTVRTSAIVFLPALFIGPVLRAQSVFHDSNAPQVSFASAEIGRALGAQRAAPDR
jgi:D-alanyl-lipoteichoic acid acyltransferase DltB (MBOAT superfamily)